MAITEFKPFANISIIGMPKSGTSSLFYWLNEHPDTEGSCPKETFFFMDDAHPLCGRHGLSLRSDGITAYEKFFASESEEKVRFEGTTHYFYQDAAREYFSSLVSSPLIVVLLREPADRILSSFRYTRDNLCNCDKSLTFNWYVDRLMTGATEDLRRFYHSEASFYIAIRELELSRYSLWADWWQERIPQNNLKLLLFEELRENPRGIMQIICRESGLDPSFYETFDFDAKNQTNPIGLQSLHRAARKVGVMIPGGSLKTWLKKRYLEFQMKTATKDDEYEWGVSVLREYFAPFNRELDSRHDLNLLQWWPASAISTNNTGNAGFGE